MSRPDANYDTRAPELGERAGANQLAAGKAAPHDSRGFALGLVAMLLAALAMMILQRVISVGSN